MNTALKALISNINEQETEPNPEPIVVTEKIIREITNGMSTRAFCTAFNISAKRVCPRGTLEYIELSPKEEPTFFDPSRL